MATDESRTSKYLGKKFNIPFYETKTRAHYVRLKIQKTQLNTSNATNPDDLSASDKGLIRARAANRFITHYFPEFYAFLYDTDKFSTFLHGNLDVANTLKDQIIGNVTILRVDQSANPSKLSIVVNLAMDIDQKRDSIKAAHCLPSFEDNLAFFNGQQLISNISAESTFDIAQIGQTNTRLNDGLKAFNQQMLNLEGQLTLNPNMGMLAQTTQSALSLAIQLLTTQLKVNAPSYKFGQADTMTIYFGEQAEAGPFGSAQIAIGRIEYMMTEESISPRLMKVGYLSNVKYNDEITDPLTLITLKNYRSILEEIHSPGGPSAALSAGFGGGGFGGSAAPGGFMSFITNPEVANALTPAATGESFASIFQPNGGANAPSRPGNAFINAAEAIAGIDLNNTDELEKGFKTAFTSAEIKSLKAQVADNPAVFMKVQNEMKKKSLQSAIDTVNVVGNILEQGPFGFAEGNPVVASLFKMLGIKELAKEAFICLTFGLNTEIGRITQAVKGALVKSQASLYAPPDLPRLGGDIRKPYIAPDDFKMFTISGDIWKQILDVVIDALQQSVIQIIKELVDLLKFNCPLNNPRYEDFGATSIPDLIDPALQTPNLIGEGSDLDQIAQMLGLTGREMIDYLRALSTILSSMEVCQLFTERSTVEPQLLDKIKDFNEEYSLPYFSERTLTYSKILAFFAKVGTMVDVRDLCNEIANEVYFANQENIELCLTPNGVPTVQMENLLDLMENGIELAMPELNFDCPDRANFISDPTITISVPELFNTLTNLVQVQFVESAESCKTSMLEQKFTTDLQNSIANSLAAAGVNYETNGWPPKLDPAFVATIIQALDSISQLDLSDCDVDPAQVLGFDPSTIAGVAGDVTEIVADTMSDPAFIDAIDNIKNTLLGLGTANADEGALMSIFPSYRFNLEFYNEFIDYIDIATLSYNNAGGVDADRYYRSRAIDNAALFSGSAPMVGEEISITDDSYKPIELTFGFPSLTRTSSTPSTPTVLGVASGEIEATTEGILSCRTQEYINEIYAFGGVVPVGHGCEGTVIPEGYPGEGTPLDGDPPPPPPTDDAEPPSAPLPLPRNRLQIMYPRENAANPNVFVRFTSQGDYIPEDELVAELTQTMLEQEFETGSNSPENIYIKAFTDAWDAIPEATRPSKTEIETQHFPTVYGLMVDNMFNYFITNGVFNAATLQSLTLFHLNENCPPTEIADLLDLDGIMRQMTKEYAQAMCNDKPEIPDRTIVRNVVKYGMYLLLVQMQIAQIFIKNIFVLTAIDLESLFANPDGFVFKFLRSQLTTSLLTFFNNSPQGDESLVRDDLVEYFNIKIRRPEIVMQGGIRNAADELVFPVGTTFSITDNSPFPGFDEILDYLISDRILLGTGAVNNAVRQALPDNNPISLEAAFLASLQTFTVSDETPAFLATKVGEYYGQDSSTTPRILLTRKYSTFITGRAAIKLWYYSGGNDPHMVNIFTLPGTIATGATPPPVADPDAPASNTGLLPLVMGGPP